MSDGFHLALWQGISAGQDPDKALDQAQDVALRAARLGADLLVFPEGYLTGYYTPKPIGPLAAAITPTHLARLAGIASESGVALVMGSYESASDGAYNSAFVVTPQEGLIGTYRKRALFGPWEEAVFQRGTGPFLFDYKGLRIGVLICYDIEFPERVRELATRGADLVVTPTALMAPYDAVPRFILQARAFENHVFLGYANRIGSEPPFDYLGQSRIISPLGEVLAEADAHEALLHARLDLRLRDKAREDYDYLADIAKQTGE
jgi:5-aminopentanamidase